MYKILIVEDDDTITAVLTRTLLKWNYEVQAVVDFGRVGEQFAQFPPTWCFWIYPCPFSTAITGARKSERQARFLLYLFHLRRTI